MTMSRVFTATAVALLAALVWAAPVIAETAHSRLFAATGGLRRRLR